MPELSPKRRGVYLKLGLCLAALSFSSCPNWSGSVAPLSDEEACKRVVLRRLAEGMLRYKEEHGKLPPAVYVDPSGNEHSWQILVLPYLLPEDERKLIKTYRFDEPWNSPHNAKITQYYDLTRLHCPAESSRGVYPFTSYLMLVRSEQPRANDDGTNASAIAEDAVVLVESAHCGVRRYEPKGLDIKTLWQADSPFGKGRLNSDHPNVVMAVRANGEVVSIPKDISKEELKTLLGGELNGGN